MDNKVPMVQVSVWVSRELRDKCAVELEKDGRNISSFLRVSLKRFAAERGIIINDK